MLEFFSFFFGRLISGDSTDARATREKQEGKWGGVVCGRGREKRRREGERGKREEGKEERGGGDMRPSSSTHYRLPPPTPAGVSLRGVYRMEPPTSLKIRRRRRRLFLHARAGASRLYYYYLTIIIATTTAIFTCTIIHSCWMLAGSNLSPPHLIMALDSVRDVLPLSLVSLK